MNHNKLILIIFLLFFSSFTVFASDGVCCHEGKCKTSGVTGIASGNTHSCFLLDNGNVVCQGDNSYGQAENYTKGNAVSVAVGERVSCFLLESGMVECQGKNKDARANDYLGDDAVAGDKEYVVG